MQIKRWVLHDSLVSGRWVPHLRLPGARQNVARLFCLIGLFIGVYRRYHHYFHAQWTHKIEHIELVLLHHGQRQWQCKLGNTCSIGQREMKEYINETIMLQAIHSLSHMRFDKCNRISIWLGHKHCQKFHIKIVWYTLLTFYMLVTFRDSSSWSSTSGLSVLLWDEQIAY